MKFSELPTTVIGRLGEVAAANEFRSDGYGVIASYKYNGKDTEAPALELSDRREILPDLDTCKAGRRRWIEIKTYAQAIWNRTLGIHVHGITCRHFENYVAVELETGSEVWLAINELDSGLLVISSKPISAMRRYGCLCGCGSDPNIRHRVTQRNPVPEWYFDRADFWSRYRFKDKTIERLRSEHDRLGHVLHRHAPRRYTNRVPPPQLFDVPKGKS